jgi:maleamate amidohydrolase
MPAWDEVITDRDRQVYAKAGYGGKLEPGLKPAILVVDVTTAFVGDKPEPILKSIERFPNSCGEAGWKAVEKIARLIEAGRTKGVPVVYTASGRKSTSDLGRWAQKHGRTGESKNMEVSTPEHIPAPIAPKEGDLVIAKLKPSAFFGTPLASHLISLGIDTLLVVGCTTSGCVRASVVDAFSYNFRVFLVEDGTFDRGEVSHAINLFDMNQKYADVITLETAMRYLGSIPSRELRTQAAVQEPEAWAFDSM